MTTLLRGKPVADRITDELRHRLEVLQTTGAGRLPQLAVILVGDDEASHVYVGRKQRMAQRVGMHARLIHLPPHTQEDALLAEIDALNHDPAVDAILIQLPLPRHIDTQRVLCHVRPDKDVDGFHPISLGKLMAGTPPVALPCTPSGILVMLDAYDIPIAGKDAVVVGRSTIVGKPLAQLLLQRDATVTLAHSRTRDLPAITRQADLLFVAVGRPGLVDDRGVKPGATVVDVGINRLEDGHLTGDVDFEAAAPVAGAITPVPGGVGPMTIAMLMKNTFALYEQHVRNNHA